jgi:glycosyltransferase involved in cell wall biosynthesis
MASPDLLFLYADWMPYNDAIASAASVAHGVRVTVVAWSSQERTDRRWIERDGARLIERSSVTVEDLVALTTSRDWAGIVVSGRMDDDYLTATRAARRRGTPIIGGSDAFDLGGPRQWAKRAFRHHLYHRYFDLLWVPGPPHERWAAKLGYGDATIPNLLSGDAELFGSVRTQAPPLADRHQLLFVGRPVPAKAVDVLVAAFDQSTELRDRGLELVLVGASAADYGVQGVEGVTCQPFLAQQDMLRFVAQARAFVLPSRWEPWGVVVHEMACAGLPLILSDRVGAAEQFLAPGVNGWQVPAEDVSALRGALEQLGRADAATLTAMGVESARRSTRCSPERSAHAVLTALGVEEPEGPEGSNP